MPRSSHGPGSCPARACVRALGGMRHEGPRPAIDKKNTNHHEMNALYQDKICNTMVATSMAKAMRQHVGRKSSILDVSRFALKWPPLYYMICPGQKHLHVFVHRWLSFCGSQVFKNLGCKFCATVVAALSCGRLAPSWHLPAADPNTKDQSRRSWPWPF